MENKTNPIMLYIRESWLLIVASLCFGFLLAGVNYALKPQIELNAIAKQTSALSALLTDAITFEEINISGEKIPDVRGMAPSDAVFLLENSGLHVRINGVGKVRNQSIPPGSNFKQGQTITLILG